MDETRFLELFEQHGHIVYPVIAVAVVALILWGILSAWRAQDLDGLAKVELKREIILELRRQIGGMSAEALSRRTPRQQRVNRAESGPRSRCPKVCPPIWPVRRSP